MVVTHHTAFFFMRGAEEKQQEVSEMGKNMKKNDLILVVVVFLVAAVVLGAYLLWPRQKGAEVIVYISGDEYARYPLEQDRVVELPGVLGSNELTISQGEVWMSKAVCPDKVCMHTGKIHNANTLIVCLPGEILVTVEGAEEDGTDVVGR